MYRYKAGIEAARQQNGGVCPWGGREAGKPNKGTLAKVDVVRQLQAQGKPIAEIARVVGLTRQTIYRLLESAPASAK
jgi:DNA invertase Pin-like site-specific DNA recombinase